MTPDDIRPAVRDFALALESTLRRNDHKPDWMSQGPREVWDKLDEERAELDIELLFGGPPERVQAEAVDEAVMALVVWMRAGGTLAAGDRGRAHVL